MGVEFRKNLLGMVCLSSAVGLLLYWVMFMSILPRVMRPGALSTMPFLSGTVGAVVIVLFYLAFSSLITFTRGKPRETLVLRRGEGGVASVGWAEIGRAVRTEVPGRQPEPPKARSSRFWSLFRSLRGRLKRPRAQETPHRRKYPKAKFVGIGASVALVLGILAWSGILTPFMVVSSQSMHPALNYGDLTIIRGESAEEIQVGDIIAFDVPSSYKASVQSPVIHRVTEKFVDGEGIYFETRGDANPNEDPWKVPAGNVLGEYAAKIPYLGFPILFAKSPFGLVFLLSLAILSFLLTKIGGRGNGA